MSQEPPSSEIIENNNKKASLFYKSNIKQFYNIDTITDRLLSYPHYKDITEFSTSLVRQLNLINQHAEGSSVNNNEQYKFQTLRSIVNETLNDIFRTNDIIHKIDYNKFNKIVKYIIKTIYGKRDYTVSSTAPSVSSTAPSVSSTAPSVSS